MRQGQHYGKREMKTNTNRVAFLLLAIAIGTCSFQSANAQEALKWKLKTGDEFAVTLTQTSDTTTSADSRVTEMKTKTTLVFDWKVTGVAANGDATIQQSLASIKLRVGNPAMLDQTIGYDTDSDEKVSRVSRPMLKQARSLIGLKYEVLMSDRGEIKGVVLPKETEVVIQKLPETTTLRTLFSEKGLKDILGASAIVLPEGELKPEESWSDQSVKISPLGKFNRVNKYTFAGMKSVDGREVAVFVLDASMEKVEDGETEKSEAAGKVIKFSGSGKLMLDVEAGYFTTCNTENEIQVEKPYREKVITSVVKNNIELTVEKK